jgi:phosphatidylglycerophosphatase A
MHPTTQAMMKTTSQIDAESPPASGAASHPPRWAWLIATFFGAGMMRPGPGTCGSLVATLLWSGVARLVAPQHRAFGALLAAAMVTAVGIPAATRFAHAVKEKDPQQVVIDEVAGQLLTLAFAPLAWKPVLAGFILFRAFDMLKPPPIRSLEKLPEGTGIVLDDLGAGVYAAIVLQLLLRTGILS